MKLKTWLFIFIASGLTLNMAGADSLSTDDQGNIIDTLSTDETKARIDDLNNKITVSQNKIAYWQQQINDENQIILDNQTKLDALTTVLNQSLQISTATQKALP